MAINIVVAVTDHDWFTTLRANPDLGEANFWSPSAQGFKALRPGELYLFKLRARYGNSIAGGGIFAHASTMPISLAWESFGLANGARSLEELRAMITGLRYESTDPLGDFDIGCRILTEPFFWDDADWIDAPPDWPSNIPRKTYNTEDPIGRRLWEQVQDRLSRQAARREDAFVADEMARYGSPQLVEPRLGQGAFRVLVTDIYSRRCAVTGERTLPALDAAHIRPYRSGGSHVTTNGLLLRKDIHSLFDAGYVTVTPDYRFQVSDSIEVEFGNGREYYALRGREIIVPRSRAQRPDRDALDWHNRYVFKR